jgi:4-carboxymuconolactone decarboxylase
MDLVKQPRFPDLMREQMSDEQKRVYDDLVAGPLGGIVGPLGVLLRIPELADCVQKLGLQLWFKKSLPARLHEFAILITARFWDSKYEWFWHKLLANESGLEESITHDLAQNKRPENMKPDEALVYDFCTTLHRDHFVDEALFKRAMETLGEQSLIELVTLTGFYTLVSMLLNVAEIMPPSDEKAQS